MSDKNTSTLQSYIDSATGAVQSAIGSLTGNTADKREGENRKDLSDARDAASHATMKLPGATATPSGIAADDPNRSAGSWNQTVGSGKEMLGNALGAESLKREGVEQNRQGKAQEAQGQMNDFGGGMKDRVHGAVGGMVAGATGDRGAEEEARRRHDEGKARQRGAEADIQRQNQ